MCFLQYLISTRHVLCFEFAEDLSLRTPEGRCKGMGNLCNLSWSRKLCHSCESTMVNSTLRQDQLQRLVKAIPQASPGFPTPCTFKSRASSCLPPGNFEELNARRCKNTKAENEVGRKEEVRSDASERRAEAGAS